MTPPWAAVIGVGNEFRRDDGIGPAVAAEVQRREIPGVRMMISQGEPAGLLDAWTGMRLTVVIDAVLCEPSAPGRFHRSSVDELALASSPPGTHGWGVPEAVNLGRVLDRMPRQLIIYTVEVQDVSIGLGLSSSITATLPVLVDAVVGELDRARAA
ncbi:MAG TPA: hydrogenase maturation protease [Pseudonocardiaceae bacterium]|nr:hydrogenase maturation protease [Pseudonocardiaceae bacterium]